MFPVCAPINTSCLTFVSLRLPVPEVAGSILIRLYKPKDSSNIGLSQIRLLGSTSFGDNFAITKSHTLTTSADQSEEEMLTKTRYEQFCHIIYPNAYIYFIYVQFWLAPSTVFHNGDVSTWISNVERGSICCC